MVPKKANVILRTMIPAPSSGRLIVTLGPAAAARAAAYYLVLGDRRLLRRQHASPAEMLVALLMA